jgi:hypothetical protein
LKTDVFVGTEGAPLSLGGRGGWAVAPPAGRGDGGEGSSRWRANRPRRTVGSKPDSSGAVFQLGDFIPERISIGVPASVSDVLQ